MVIGNVTNDSIINIDDAYYIINWIAGGGSTSSPNVEYSVDDEEYNISEDVDIGAAQYIINWIAAGGSMTTPEPGVYSVNEVRYSIVDFNNVRLLNILAAHHDPAPANVSPEEIFIISGVENLNISSGITFINEGTIYNNANITNNGTFNNNGAIKNKSLSRLEATDKLSLLSNNPEALADPDSSFFLNQNGTFKVGENKETY